MQPPELKSIRIENDQQSLNLLLFKKIARIALWVSGLSLITLGALVLAVNNPSGDYLSMLTTLANSQENLLFIIILAGVWLLSATAITTYVITLYSSFRVAGPLFRFARNLEFGHQHENPMPHIRIRNYDYFQEECRLMDESIDTLINHYRTLAEQVDAINKLNAQEPIDKVVLIEKIMLLRDQANRLTS